MNLLHGAFQLLILALAAGVLLAVAFAPTFAAISLLLSEVYSHGRMLLLVLLVGSQLLLLWLAKGFLQGIRF